jgi:hypothetical protein
MLMGIFGHAVLGLCKRAHWTDSACCRTTWGGKLNDVWPQDEHQTMYAMSLLKHVVVVLSRSEGSQNWLAPCGTDVHRLAPTDDVCVLEQKSHRQTKMIM